MQLNPALLPLSLHLQRDYSAAVRRVRRAHHTLASDPDGTPESRASHAHRAARLGNWLGWIAYAYQFRPWMLDYEFPARPASLAGAPFPPRLRSGRMPADAIPRIVRYRLRWPNGRPPSPWRVPFQPHASPLIPSEPH